MSSCGVVTVFLDSNRNFTKTVTKTINNLNFYFKLEILKQRKKKIESITLSNTHNFYVLLIMSYVNVFKTIFPYVILKYFSQIYLIYD